MTSLKISATRRLCAPPTLTAPVQRGDMTLKQIGIYAQDELSMGNWRGTVGVSEHLGSDTFFHVHDTGLGGPVTVRADGEVTLSHGDTVFLTPQEGKVHRFGENGLRL